MKEHCKAADCCRAIRHTISFLGDEMISKTNTVGVNVSGGIVTIQHLR